MVKEGDLVRVELVGDNVHVYINDLPVPITVIDQRQHLAVREQAALIEKCYDAARGTKNLLRGFSNRSQMYWKGRADAATDVRKLLTEKNLHEPETKR
jgi:hypothetical protein